MANASQSTSTYAIKCTLSSVGKREPNHPSPVRNIPQKRSQIPFPQPRTGRSLSPILPLFTAPFVPHTSEGNLTIPIGSLEPTLPGTKQPPHLATLSFLTRPQHVILPPQARLRHRIFLDATTRAEHVHSSTSALQRDRRCCHRAGSEPSPCPDLHTSSSRSPGTFSCFEEQTPQGRDSEIHSASEC